MDKACAVLFFDDLLAASVNLDDTTQKAKVTKIHRLVDESIEGGMAEYRENNEPLTYVVNEVSV